MGTSLRVSESTEELEMDSHRTRQSGPVSGGMRCLGALAIAVLIVASGLAAGILARNAAAQVPLKFTGWNGYQGNKVIYMTTGISSLNAYVISTVYAHATGTSRTIKDAVNVSAGQSPRTLPSDRVFHEYYDSTISNLIVDIPIAAAGAGQTFQTLACCTVVEPGSQKVNLAVSGAPSTMTTNIQTTFNSGINVTGPSLVGTTKSEALTNLALDAISFLPDAGFAIGVYQTMHDLESLSGVQTSKTGVSGTGAVYESFGVTGGTLIPGKKGQNVFTSQILVQLRIPSSAFSSQTMRLTLTGTNQLISCSGSGGNCKISSVNGGATASATVYVYPAVTVTGTVYAGGSPAANQVIDFTTANSQFILTYETKTDASGNYRWFAAPNTFYSLSAPYQSTFGAASASTGFTTPRSSSSMTANLVIPVSRISGQVKDATSAAPIQGASVQATSPGGTSATVSTDAGGNYALTVLATGTYSLTASASSHSSQTTPVTVSALNAAYTASFSLTYVGGGGCVARGTPILTPNGYVPIQDLKPGDAVMGYDFATGKLVAVTLLSARKSWQDSLVSINGGQLLLTAQDQPIFADHAGVVGWVRNPADLQLGDRIFNAVSGHWVRVWSVQPVYQRVEVYDVVTSGANNFVANGYLLDQKCVTC